MSPKSPTGGRCPECEGTGLVWLNGLVPFACGLCDGTGTPNPIWLVSARDGREAWLDRQTGLVRCPVCSLTSCVPAADIPRLGDDAEPFPGVECPPQRGGCGAVLFRVPPVTQ